MDSKSAKAVTKKYASATERTTQSSKKSSQGNKKKKKNKKKVDSKDLGKTSTSPDVEASDCNLESESSVANRQHRSKISGDISHSNPSLKKTSSSANHTPSSHPSAKGLNSCLQTNSSNYSVQYTSLVAINGSNSQSIAKYDRTVDSIGTKMPSNRPKPFYQSGYPQATLMSNPTTQTRRPDKNHMPPILHQESLRWENELSDPEAEEERLRSYKLNRRKRYVNSSNQSYTEWISKYNATSNDAAENKLSAASKSPRSRSSDRLNLHKVGSNSNLSQDMPVGLSNMAYTAHGHEIMLNC